MPGGRLWAIGDIQGCDDAFSRLLEKIRFDPGADHLWLAGDLVNRGPDSLATLRRCYRMRQSVTVVLGNHDLHLLAVRYGSARLRRKDTLLPILEAEDAQTLLDWLRQQPLVHLDHHRKVALAHAGILPSWSMVQAGQYASEVEAVLRSENCREFLDQMYGNTPDQWSESLAGVDRLRFITNVFTRMRVLRPDQRLELTFKGPPEECDPLMRPWYAIDRGDDWRIFFGHWAALDGRTARDDRIALDVGCVWGKALRAMEVDRGTICEVPAVIRAMPAAADRTGPEQSSPSQ